VNYRHAFHAGNFADCFKHALLLALLEALKRKPTAFRVLDTHAGRGRYDLSSPEAQRTGEWQGGILRLADIAEGPLAPYLAAVRALGFPAAYPGSPALIRAVLRPQDQLTCCELHPEEHAALRRLFAGDPQTSVHRRDAYEALRALTPFPERRGLVLLDPPFEQDGEFDRLAAGLAEANRRFRAAILAAWYPIKHRTPVRAFHDAIRASTMRDTIAAELWLREPTDPTLLNGCGMLIVNPPYGFPEQAETLLATLRTELGGTGTAMPCLTPE